jgi:SPP1 gp7 family putative phage head morphogenesis protein
MMSTYQSALAELQNWIVQEFHDWLSVRTDSWREDATPYSKLRRIYGKLGELVRPKELGMIERAAQSIRSNVETSLERVPGIDRAKLLHGGQARIVKFRERNARLITEIGKQHLDRVAKLLESSDVASLHVKGIAEKLQAAFDISESRAEFWARDQTLKLNAEVTKDRQTSVGIEEYFWRDSGDEAVRLRHKELAEMSNRGIAFRWDDPPPIVSEPGQPERRAHPGGDYQCRCTAEPKLPD